MEDKGSLSTAAALSHDARPIRFVDETARAIKQKSCVLPSEVSGNDQIGSRQSFCCSVLIIKAESLCSMISGPGPRIPVDGVDFAVAGSCFVEEYIRARVGVRDNVCPTVSPAVFHDDEFNFAGAFTAKDLPMPC